MLTEIKVMFLNSKARLIKEEVSRYTSKGVTIGARVIATGARLVEIGARAGFSIAKEIPACPNATLGKVKVVKEKA